MIKRILAVAVLLVAGLAIASEITVIDSETGKKYRITLPAQVEGTVTEVTETDPEPPPPPPPEEGIPQPDSFGNIVLRKSGVYELDRDLTNRVFIANKNIELRLNGHSITANNEGVKNYAAWRDGDIYGKRPTPDNTVIRGPGRIESMTTDAVNLYVGKGLAIDGATLVCHGVDASCVRTSSSLVIRNCLCLSYVTKTNNRHQMPSVVRCEWGSTDMQKCAIIGGQVGVLARTGSVVSDNFISVDSIATNGYGVAIYRVDNVLVENNLIVANNGRGVLINGGTGKDTDRGNLVRDNVIFAREKPNAEFGGALNANCIRVRYDAMNNQVSSNVCLAVGGPPYTGGTGLYLSNDVGFSSTFIDNTFQAVLDGELLIGRHYGKAITLESQGNWNKETGEPRYNLDVINDNILRSNHINLSLAGIDGYNIGAHMSNPLTDNTFQIEDGGIILADFAATATSKLESLGLAYPEASERLEGILASFANYDEVSIRQYPYDVWTESAWRGSANISIKGSGPEVKPYTEDGVNVRRSVFPGAPLNITIEP